MNFRKTKIFATLLLSLLASSLISLLAQRPTTEAEFLTALPNMGGKFEITLKDCQVGTAPDTLLPISIEFTVINGKAYVEIPEYKLELGIMTYDEVYNTFTAEKRLGYLTIGGDKYQAKWFNIAANGRINFLLYYYTYDEYSGLTTTEELICTYKGEKVNITSEEPKPVADETTVIPVTSVQKSMIEWASIPAGTFEMGSNVNEPLRDTSEEQHSVTLSAFKMSKYEVTFELYDQFCKATNRSFSSDEGWGRGKNPALNVSWDDANAFAKWMGCRLPTEAEWEYACRAGSTTPFNTGDKLTNDQSNINGLKALYNSDLKGIYLAKTVPVGSYAPNNWGLYDMHGNVSEWCSDWFGDYASAELINPKGAETGVKRVTRGGCYCYGGAYCRSASRFYYEPVSKNSYIGIRLVLLEDTIY